MKTRTRLMTWLVMLIALFILHTSQAENAFSEIAFPQLDENAIKEIQLEAELPGDYDFQRAMQGMDYLVKVEGFSIAGAAGLIGNGYAESRLLLNPGKGFYKGLFQWDGKCRWPKVKKYLEENDVNFEDEDELYIWELMAAINSEDAQDYEVVIEFCKQCGSSEESAERWCRKFEGTKQALSLRKKVARKTLNAYRLYIKLRMKEEKAMENSIAFFVLSIYNEYNKKWGII